MKRGRVGNFQVFDFMIIFQSDKSTYQIKMTAEAHKGKSFNQFITFLQFVQSHYDVTKESDSLYSLYSLYNIEHRTLGVPYPLNITDTDRYDIIIYNIYGLA